MKFLSKISLGPRMAMGEKNPDPSNISQKSENTKSFHTTKVWFDIFNTFDVITTLRIGNRYFSKKTS